MQETPANYPQTAGRVARSPARSLARYQWHTGAPLRPLDRDEVCPVLFRDVGPVATARFLRGGLQRLAGPFSPITYMRTADYREPYVDHGHIGRLVLLRPLGLRAWHSGVPTVYVADAAHPTDWSTVGYVPADIELAEASRLLADVPDRRGLRDVFGRAEYDIAVGESLARLERLNAELERTERLAEPLRRAFQSGDKRRRMQARELMQRWGLTESDLCTAWHHLPEDRRKCIQEVLPRMGGV